MSQKILFSGLNAHKKSIETFQFNYYENDLSKIFTTFDSILSVNTNNSESESEIVNISKSNLFYFDLNDKLEFKTVNIENLNEEIDVNLSTNTDYYWLLDNKRINLMQLPNPATTKSVKITQIKAQNEIKNHIFICSTDVNVYLLDSKQGKCIYQLEYESLIDDTVNKINESPIMAIPLNKVFFDENIKSVSCGKEHVLVLTEPSGHVYSFGIGTRGQLGHGTIDNCYEPKRIENFSNVKSIACGGWHSSLIDQNGDVYVWGWNSNGQLGVDDDEENNDEEIISLPTLLTVFDDFGEKIKFKKVSLGSRHSLLIDTNGNLYSFGWNKYNQLFCDTNKVDIRSPTLVNECKTVAKDCKCGPWYSLVLIE